MSEEINETNQNETRFKKHNRYKNRKRNLQKESANLGSNNENSLNLDEKSGAQNSENAKSMQNNKKFRQKNRHKSERDSDQNSLQEAQNLSENGDVNSNDKADAKINAKSHQNQKKKNKNLPSNLTGNQPWQIAVAQMIEANKAMHDERLHPLKFAPKTDGKILITPLG